VMCPQAKRDAVPVCESFEEILRVFAYGEQSARISNHTTPACVIDNHPVGDDSRGLSVEYYMKVADHFGLSKSLSASEVAQLRICSFHRKQMTRGATEPRELEIPSIDTPVADFFYSRECASEPRCQRLQGIKFFPS
jgi:hypothetical protein